MRYYRKIIRITADDSPNVRRAKKILSESPHTSFSELCERSTILPGVLTWEEYCKRVDTWDKMRQCVGLWGQFWYGAELLLFPPEWLNHSIQLAAKIGQRKSGKAMGVDPAEGGDRSTWCIVDDQGVIHMEALLTPNTAVIPRRTISLIREFNVPVENVCFDRGGGGQQHVDTLREAGYNVRSVGFGEGITMEPKRRTRAFFSEKVEQKETKYEFCNRRAQMYGELSEIMEPNEDGSGGFAIPQKYNLAFAEGRKSLIAQLGLIPKLYDKEGRLRMLPKNDPSISYSDALGEEEKQTLVAIIGHSPDEADALVLALHALLHKRSLTSRAGAVA